MSQGRMTGRRVLICGGGSGIGQAAALICAREGAVVTAVGRRRARVEEVAGQTGGYGIVADLTVESETFVAVNNAANLMNGIDGLLNCVGVLDTGSLEEIDLVQWEASLRTNLTSHYLACRAALPHLRKNPQASIVNVAALAGIRPGVSSAAYSAAKAGVIQFTKTIAAQLAPAIRANSVCPGAVATQKMIDGYLSTLSPEQVKAFLNRYACQRLATPVEVANLLLFLLSSEASYITGCNYAADGGRSYA